MSHLHLLPVSPKSGRDRASCGKQEPALLVLAGPSFTTQTLPPSTGEACVPQSQQDPRGRDGKKSCSAECLHILGKEGDGCHGARGRKPVLTHSRRLCWEHSPLLSLDMGLYTLSRHPADCPPRGASSPSVNTECAQLRLHQTEQLVLPGFPTQQLGPCCSPRLHPGTLTVSAQQSVSQASR